MNLAPHEPATLVLEIGVEEIPALALYAATQQLAELAKAALAKARIEHGDITTRSTPRRLVLEVKRLATTSTPLVQRFKGPAVKIAYDQSGQPTAAAQGFARSKGVSVQELIRAKEGQTDYVFAQTECLARRSDQLLPSILARLIADIKWPKVQRWDSREETFIRPVRWICALWGPTIIPVSFAGVNSGRITWGHRLIANQPLELASAEDLASAHTKLWVIDSAEMRAAHIKAQIKTLREKSELMAQVPAETLAEVVNLVEFPTTLLGSFDTRFLELPPEVLTNAMLKHQRYFPTLDAKGNLSNHFMVVSNGSPAYNSTIIAGHERVIRPRLADAAFFYASDRKQPLASYLEDLRSVVFHEKLGSLYDKAERLRHLSGALAALTQASSEQAQCAQRAALLAKADLVTNVVVEFTDLQGVMGSYYALDSGEKPGVALAIREHYQPRFAGDSLPDSLPGQLVALADKLDSIAGIFAAGQAPSGSADPYALRRAAIGIINMLLNKLTLPLSEAIALAVAGLNKIPLTYDTDALKEQIRAFFAARLEVIAQERGLKADTVAAVLATGTVEPAELLARAAALDEARSAQSPVFADLYSAYTRANNLRQPNLVASLDAQLFGAAESRLDQAITQVGEGVAAALAAGKYDFALSFLAGLKAPLDDFFDAVMIMDADERLRANRLLLLNRFVDVFAYVADFSQLAGV
ncbi:MAG: glycine--tRNA ligase subunit beta [Coriobacteriales bacterium]|nr:glycine--tRNA ligase subunit beta [Coriobacteriales bacterium]